MVLGHGLTFPSYWDSFLALLILSLATGIILPVTLAGSLPAIGLIFFIIHGCKIKKLPKSPIILGLFLIALMTMCAFSTLWSVTPTATWERAIKVSGLMLSLYMLVTVAASCPRDTILKFKNIFIVAILCAGTLIALQLHFSFIQTHTEKTLLNAANLDFAKSAFNKSVAVFTFLLPSIVSLSRGKCRAIILTLTAAISAAIFVETESQASQLAMIVMFICGFGMLPFLNNITRYLMFSGFIALALLMPFIGALLFELCEKIDIHNTIIPATGLMRFENWDFLTREILHKPWIGHGMDTTRAMHYVSEAIFYPGTNVQILHTHNGFLQMWMEYGLLGAVFTAVSIGVYAATKPSRLHLTTFCGVMAVFLLSWSIWSSWLIAAFFGTHAIILLAATAKTDRAMP